MVKKVVEKEYWVAYDGTKFDNEKEAVDYENTFHKLSEAIYFSYDISISTAEKIIIYILEQYTLTPKT